MSCCGWLPWKRGSASQRCGLLGLTSRRKKYGDIGGLLFGFLAEAAFAGFEGGGEGYVAEAVAHVGAGEGQQEQRGAENTTGQANGG